MRVCKMMFFTLLFSFFIQQSFLHEGNYIKVTLRIRLSTTVFVDACFVCSVRAAYISARNYMYAVMVIPFSN